MDGFVLASSVWSARYQKRHAAITRDKTYLVSRLCSIESAISNLDAKVDEILATLNSSYLPVADAYSRYDRTPFCQRLDDNIEEIAARLDPMELLLFRTSLTDSASLDDDIAASMPKVFRMQVLPFPVEKEPEGEMSLIKRFHSECRGDAMGTSVDEAMAASSGLHNIAEAHGDKHLKEGMEEREKDDAEPVHVVHESCGFDEGVNDGPLINIMQSAAKSTVGAPVTHAALQAAMDEAKTTSVQGMGEGQH